MHLLRIPCVSTEGTFRLQAWIVACSRAVSVAVGRIRYVYILVYIRTNPSLQFGDKVHCQVFTNWHRLGCDLQHLSENTDGRWLRANC